MVSPNTPEQLDMEIWREAWEKQVSGLPPLMRPEFDQRLCNDATHACKVVHLLKEHGIQCCIVGAKALLYYGAGRASTTFEFCVPTEQLAAADLIFSAGSATNDYTAWKGWNPDADVRLQGSLYHTFPRYRLNHGGEGELFDFYLVPSIDWRFDCVPENFEYSAQMRLPYPGLHLFAQSLMERQDFVDLQDLIDGMDLTEEWGDEKLHFDYPGNDSEYAKWVVEKNERIVAALPQEIKDEPMNVTYGLSIYQLPQGPADLREKFNHYVRTKQQRVGPEYPPGVFVTRFRAKGSPDPRTEIRFNV